MKNLLTKSIILSSGILFPIQIFAANGQTPTDFRSFIFLIIKLLQAVIPILFVLAVLYFFYGIIKLIQASGSGNQEGIEQGKQILLWGIVAIFVMFSFWSIVAIISGEFFDLGGFLIPFLKIKQ